MICFINLTNSRQTPPPNTPLSYLVHDSFTRIICTRIIYLILTVGYYNLLISVYTITKLFMYRPISRVVIGHKVDYRSRLIYVRYCLTNTTLCLLRSYDCTLACTYV